MRHFAYTIIAAIALLLPTVLHAEKHLSEMVYLSTDKSVYVAGDNLWISAYCIDRGKKQLSTFSEIAYIEIMSGNKSVQTAKIALHNGRGAGKMVLSNTIPTGNYKLVAYTAQSCNEYGFNYDALSRTISIFNTLSTERGNVVFSDQDAAPQSQQRTGQQGQGAVRIDIGTASDGVVAVTLTNYGSKAADINLSVYHKDSIKEPENCGISSIQAALDEESEELFLDKKTAEYEGEIIHAKLVGSDAEEIGRLVGKHVYISSPGDLQSLYTSTIGKDGSTSFYTGNIFGNKDMFIEIEDVPADCKGHLELTSPFISPAVRPAPALQLSKDQEADLGLRNSGMQIERIFEADSLYSALPIERRDIFGTPKRYILDDYTRFPLMEELFTEFIPELRARSVNKKKELQIKMEDYFGSLYFSQSSSLALIDGVPILDQNQLFSYDPLLVKYIDIYPYCYALGSRSFRGVVNFITYKGNVPSLTLPSDVRVINFQGTSYPEAFTTGKISEDYPDYRQTIGWNPEISLGAGESITIKCKTPAYSGRFEVAVEGMTEDCGTISARSAFDLE